MHNNTLNEEDYKEAVRSKYEKEKKGIYSNYLGNPSQANLRDLCWKIFKSNQNTDDLNVYDDFFKFKFDSENEDTSISYTDKFKKVGRFFKGETKPAKIETVDFAAILVDFQPRPYVKFRRIGVSEKEIEIPKESDSLILEEVNEDEKKEQKNEDASIVEGLLINKKETIKFSEKFKRKLKETIITITIIFCLIAMVIYFAYFKKDCMQWTGDYYEKVDCIQEIKSSDIKPYDEIQFELKKINVSDTTSFFKLGKPCIWYGKSFEGNYDCFTAPGLHPETGKTLKPITQYIANKYLLKSKDE
ncbi:hypothetical protein [Flavobacterium sp.]|uniref:hypothetical protein n=1 Tax=Flavobacterium sp. TaxID=239 RepID=UPI003264E7FF